MPIYTEKQLKAYMESNSKAPDTVYLIIGDRFLCKQASGQLERTLVGDNGTIHTIDGDREDPATTISRLCSYSLLPGRQIYRVTDTKLFYSKKVAKGLWEKLLKAKAENNSEATIRNLLALMTAGGLSPDIPDNSPAELSGGEWKKCFDFPHPGENLSWINELLSKAEQEIKSDGGKNKKRERKEKKTASEPAALFEETIKNGIPKNNFVILLAEDVDKRKKLFKYLKKNHTLIDLSVEKGASKKAKTAQNQVIGDLIRTTVADMGKQLENRVMEELINRVGFHPVAAVIETEKLCLSVGEQPRITMEDMEKIIGHTRQDAIFELSSGVGNRNLEQALVISRRLTDNAVHPLAIIATLRNFARSLLLCRSLLEQPKYGWFNNISANVFQNRCLPKIKEQQRWEQEFKGHPYAVYMQFKTADSFSLTQLSSWMEQILQAEQRLKGVKGAVAGPVTILHHLLISMLVPTGK
jgi:DNA polymerase-3 subunit delta